jgi:phosphomethylpyrimidine synthase
LIIEARSSSFVDVIAELAKLEGVDYEVLRRRVASGRVVIPRDVRKEEARLVGIGEGLTTKVNVNAGTSGVYVDLEFEVEKVRVALKYGTMSTASSSVSGASLKATSSRSSTM